MSELKACLKIEELVRMAIRAGNKPYWDSTWDARISRLAQEAWYELLNIRTRPTESKLRAELTTLKERHRADLHDLEEYRKKYLSAVAKLGRATGVEIDLRAENERLRGLVECALNYTTGSDWFKFEKEAKIILEEYEPITMQEAMRREEALASGKEGEKNGQITDR